MWPVTTRNPKVPTPTSIAWPKRECCSPMPTVLNRLHADHTAFLTGRMAFRNGMRGVFTGAGGPCLVKRTNDDQQHAQATGFYTTALYSKWHVGLTFFDKGDKPILRSRLEPVKIDYSRPITDGPLHRGFDHFSGRAAHTPTPGFTPTSTAITSLSPAKIVDRTPLPKHPYSRDNRPGMIAPGFDLEEVDMVFLQRASSSSRPTRKNHPTSRSSCFTRRRRFIYHPSPVGRSRVQQMPGRMVISFSRWISS